jgi:hypothetical protein
VSEPFSVSGAVGKAAGLVFRPIFSAVRKEVAKRGADSLAGRNPLSLDADLSAAIDVLLNDAETAFDQLKVWLKAAISAPPEILTEESARTWLARADVQDVLKQAAIAFITGQPLDPYVEDAKRLYGDSSGEGEWYGEPLFTHAVAFMVLSISAEIDTGTKVLLEASNVRAAQSSAESAAILERVGDLSEQIDALGMQGQLPVEAMDRYLASELQRRERLRSVAKIGKLENLLKLGEEVFDGSLKAASPQAKAELFRFIAAEQARDGDIASAESWLVRAVEAGAADVANDKARIAIQRGDPAAAILLLDGRTDRIANSLRIDALRKSKGDPEAISYFEDYGSADILTGHALPALAQSYIEVGRGYDSERLLAGATPEQIFENPLLLFQRARVRLALMASGNAAELFRQSAVLPNPKALRNDAEGRRLAGLAVEDLTTLELILKEVGETDFIGIVEPQKLYLQLLFEKTAGDARAVLEGKLSDPDEALVFSGLARIFDVPFNPAVLKAQLAQARRLREWTDPELHSAFQLQITEHDPAALLQFIADNREGLERVEPVMSIGVEVEALVRAGRGDEAKARLDAAADRLPEDDRRLLSDLVADKGNPTLATNLARFEETGDERDLNLLVQSMIDAKDPRSGEYAAKLWRARHRVEDVLAAANAFAFFAQDDELERLLDEVGADADADPRLQTHRAWLHYRRGDMAEARKLLVVLKAENPDDEGLRQLEINVALEMGDWQRLGDRIEADLQQVHARSPQQLLQSAALAHFAKHPETMTLIRAAVAKSPEDPSVLMWAWELGVRLGIDNEEEVSSWMSRAVTLSGDNGMFRKAKLEDVIALRDQSAERAKELDSLIMTGQVTVGMATKPLGTTLTELMLERIWQNADIADPRQRLFLPFYAGNRGRFDLTGIDSIALDLPSTMHLYMTGLLERVFEAFPKVVLPSGTMATLFEHMRQAERGQPSRTKRAALVEHLIEAKKIIVLPSGDSGTDEVDQLWAAAEAKDGIIIHAPPLYVPGSFLEEVRDPEPFKTRLASPLALAEALQGRASEEKEGESEAAGDAAPVNIKRFSTFAEHWPDEPANLLKHPLMIDGTALIGLADADLLEPLLDSGARIFVTTDVPAMCARERAEEETRQLVLARIEGLRSILSNALLQGRARIGPAPSRKSRADEDFSSDPLMALLDRPGDVQVLISDERVVNRYPHATDSAGINRAVATSLDLIDTLVARKTIAGYVRETARTRLRASGVGLIPLADGEFVAAARRSNWAEGPGPELKTIRDSILLPLFRRGVQLPEEQPWLAQILFSLAKAIRDVFRDLDSSDDAQKAADFALACVPDIRAYVGDAAPDVRRWTSQALVAFHGLVANAPDMPKDRLGPFHDWYEQNLYPLLRGRDGDLLPAVTAQIKQFVTEDFEDRLDLKVGDYQPTKQDLALFMFRRVPKPLANALLQDEEVREALGVEGVMPLDIAGHKVDRPDLFEFLRSGHSGKKAVLKDRDGKVIAKKAEKLDDGSIRVTIGKQHIRFEHSGLFSGDEAVRTSAMRELLSRRTLAIDIERKWLERANVAPFSDEEFFEVTKAADQTPQGFVEDVADELTGESFAIADLVPKGETYFVNLLPAPDGTSLAKMFKTLRVSEKGRISRVDAVIASGPLAISPEYDAAQLAKGMTRQDQFRCCEVLVAAGDPFSLLAAFQIACAGIPSPKLRAIGDKVMEIVWGEASSLESRLTDFHSGVIVTSAAILERGDMQGWTLDRRRLATFAHAGHIARVLGQFKVQNDELLNRTLDAFGPYHQLGGALDQRFSIGWEAGLLTAKAIKAYLLRRFSAVLAEVAEAKRPTEWVERLQARIAELDSPADKLLLSLPGPVDEFTGHMPDRPTMDVGDYADFLKMLEKADPIPASNLAYIYPMALTLPEGADAERLRTILIAKLDQLEGDDLVQSVQIVLLLTWRWRLPELAKAIFHRFGSKNDLATTVLNWAILASAAEVEPVARQAMLEELSLSAAFLSPKKIKPAALAHSLATIVNAAPELAPALAKARSAAALAI